MSDLIREKNTRIEIDHADIVVTHSCGFGCPHCIDKLVNTDKTIISTQTVEKFLTMLREKTTKYRAGTQKNDGLTVLLLGGEPTMAGSERLIEIASLVHKYGFNVSMSTNGLKKDVIAEVAPCFDWIQVTFHSWKEFEYWNSCAYRRKINIKLSGDKTLTKEKLDEFILRSQWFNRSSVSMYFTPDFKELCEDAAVWDFLNALEWTRLGSYMYAFHNGVRFKRCIPGETNIINEDLIPKLYPNGNYNRTWNNEDLDDYIDGHWLTK